MTTTYETLSRYKFYNEGNFNSVEETVTYCRVPQGDIRILELSKMKHWLKKGHAKLFNGVRYDLYAIFSDVSYLNHKRRGTRVEGYRLVQRKGITAQPINTLHYSVGMYFIYKKKEG